MFVIKFGINHNYYPEGVQESVGVISVATIIAAPKGALWKFIYREARRVYLHQQIDASTNQRINNYIRVSRIKSIPLKPRSGGHYGSHGVCSLPLFTSEPL